MATHLLCIFLATTSVVIWISWHHIVHQLQLNVSALQKKRLKITLYVITTEVMMHIDSVT